MELGNSKKQLRAIKLLIGYSDKNINMNRPGFPQKKKYEFIANAFKL
jgi:hypothetical protein